MKNLLWPNLFLATILHLLPNNYSVKRSDIDVELLPSQVAMLQSVSSGSREVNLQKPGVFSHEVKKELSSSFAEPLDSSRLGKEVRYPKKALIIGISRYPPENGWLPTHAKNDVKLMRQALVRQGFEPAAIRVIQDQQATKAGILQAIRQWLIDPSRPGDVAVFHFSGHGQQVYDKNGDEPDRYDEALVPYDAPVDKRGGYRGERHLVDDELNQIFKTLRARLGPTGNLWVNLDACHSGTANRSMSRSRYFRGSTKALVPEGLTAISANIAVPNHSLSSNQWNLGHEQVKSLAPMIVFSATNENQLNQEVQFSQGQYIGPLSYALHQSLSKFSSNGTYRALFEEVSRLMKKLVPEQDAYFEGLPDYQLFSAQPKKTPPHFKVSEINDLSRLTISAGSLNGLQQGTRLNLYPMNTYDTSKTEPSARGKVIHLGLWESTVSLTRNNKEDLQDHWVMPSQPTTSAMKVKVEVQGETPLLPLIRKAIANSPQIKEVKSSSDLVWVIDSTSNLGSSVSVIDSRDNLLYRDIVQRDPALWVSVIDRAIQVTQRFGRVAFLRTLEAEHENLPINFELIPVSAKKNTRGFLSVDQYLLPTDFLNVEGTLQLDSGMYYKIRIINSGKQKAYFTILDIFSDHQVKCLYPQNMDPERAWVAPGDTLMLPFIYYATEPYGLDHVKLIACNVPIYPASLSRGRDQAASSDWQQLLQEVLPKSQSRDKSKVYRAASVTVKTFRYETVAPLKPN